MESRNISLTLDKAKEWYNSGSADLREVALQAYSEKELKEPLFKSIKTFEDACKVLGISYCPASPLDAVLSTMGVHLCNHTRASIAAIELNIIRQALNKDQKMEFTKGTIWYPYNPFITKKSTYYKDEIRNGEMSVVGKFRVDCEEYLLLGGRARAGSNAGLGYFFSSDGVGYSGTDVGFLGCATKEIAQHMGKYFAKEIFEAKYGDFVDYEWV